VIIEGLFRDAAHVLDDMGCLGQSLKEGRP
jgi:hypothetical protein